MLHCFPHLSTYRHIYRYTRLTNFYPIHSIYIYICQISSLTAFSCQKTKTNITRNREGNTPKGDKKPFRFRKSSQLIIIMIHTSELLLLLLVLSRFLFISSSLYVTSHLFALLIITPLITILLIITPRSTPSRKTDIRGRRMRSYQGSHR